MQRTLLRLAGAVYREGFAVLPRFLDRASCRALRAAVERLGISDFARVYPKSTRVWDLYRHGPAFVDVLSNVALRRMLEELLGINHLLSDYSANIVNPGQPVDDWHVDYPYNEMENRTSGSLLGLQCVLALDDFSKASGATRLIPGSHLSSERPDFESTPAFTFEAAAGTLLIMAAATWHRSGQNTTEKPRPAMLLSYVERWVRPLSDAPGDGPWARTEYHARLLGIRRPPESINGVPL